MVKYRHYKGNVYELVGYATHSETNEKFVIYKNQSGEMFARPYRMFFEEIESNGKKIKRFSEIKE